jgi:16S rRNA (cytosine1402-N4)-methyltransferase
VFVDATFGAGGHTTALLDAIPSASVIALDADPAAVQRARALAPSYPNRLIPSHANFANLATALDRSGVEQIDGIVYDLGISSLQLADSTRGFSFAGDEPLDMRLDPTSGEPSASDLLSRLPEMELGKLLREYGDERHARAIARSIVRRRSRVQQWRTGDLVGAVLSVQRGRARGRLHPATRTFQALRMAVNDDVHTLERSLDTAVRRLREGGRMVVISFHSVEDRVVKQRFKAFVNECAATLLTRKPLRPGAAEVRSNIRSRSAKLRAVERTSTDYPLGTEE